MDLTEIEEGNVVLSVPEHEDSEGPKEVRDEVFYNPSMRINRDICISFLKAWFDEKRVNVLDGMAASGVRGLRIKKETSISDVTINDLSEKAAELIEKNAEKNSLDVEVSKDSIEKHLLNNRYEYDYIDIDPFGSPVPYYPLAARYISHEGIVGVTATDTSVLCGTYPTTCFRKYSSEPKNNWCRHENGLRILIAYCAREAARYDKWVKPLLSYYEGHHFRTYLQIGDGAQKADECLDKLNRIRFYDHWWEEGSAGDEKNCGPFWTGDLYSEKILEQMEKVGELSEKLLSLWKNEAGLPPFFYDTNEISSSLKEAPPPMKDIIDSLKEKSFKASKTHFLPTGIKTDVSIEDMKEIFLDH
ncbi:MAG: tRNA (guanine(10)-N(2))-dimethyltransferase [Candidatus Thermoplasmatota archaeon]|nr:tRNA (guanine(10)-N(2))-dimethyltransferase [Candidatus Thermoplasmatota archaeon]